MQCIGFLQLHLESAFLGFIWTCVELTVQLFSIARTYAVGMIRRSSSLKRLTDTKRSWRNMKISE